MRQFVEPPPYIGANLEKTLATLKMPAVSGYQATRHTFAGHWVMAGGSIEKPREVLGHSSVVVTERYAHLRTDLFGQAELSRVAVDLSVATGKILSLPAVTHPAGEAGKGAAGYAGVTIDPRGHPGGTVSKLDHSSAGVAKRYTQRTQNPPPVRAYEFKSRLRHTVAELRSAGQASEEMSEELIPTRPVVPVVRPAKQRAELAL